MKGKKVWVASCNAGIIGVFENRNDALKSADEHADGGYKGTKIQELTIK